MDKLKPCPFCGCEVMDIIHDNPDESKSEDWVVECRRCLAMGPPEMTKQEAITAWNNRVEDKEWEMNTKS